MPRAPTCQEELLKILNDGKLHSIEDFEHLPLANRTIFARLRRMEEEGTIRVIVNLLDARRRFYVATL